MSDFDENTRVTQALQVSPGGGATTGGTDCLIVIYTKEPTLLGKRFVLDHNPTRVGRGADNQIVLEGDSVSRRHAHFEHRGGQWLVIDDGSTNGTFCNDEQIARERVLRNGDRVKIGHNIFKFLSGADVEAQYHEEIYRMTIIDGLTQIHNKRYLYQALEREIVRGRRHERNLAILLFDIDHFKRINDVHGHLAGDFVLKELVRIVQSRIRRDEVFARYGGDELCIVLPETSLDSALSLAETLREKIQEHRFVFRAERIKVTISIGATLLSDSERSGNELIKRADELLYEAKQSGRNRVVSGVGSSPRHRRPLEGPSFLEKVLAASAPAALVAFEIDDELAIVQLLGRNVYEVWFRDLVRDVESVLGDEDILGTWRDRHVLAAFHQTDTSALRALAARVSDAWTHRYPAKDSQVVKPQLRFAILTDAELASYQDRALHVLVGRLLPPAPAKATPEDDLPFPLAALRAMVSTRRTALGRVRSLLDGIRTALRFTTSIAVAAIREGNDAATQLEAASLLARRWGTRDAWEHDVLALLHLMERSRVGALLPLHRAFRDASERVPWEKTLSDIAALRTTVNQRHELSEDAFGPQEQRLKDTFDTILRCLKPLSDTRLVSVAEMEHADEDGVFDYGLYLYRGPGEHFPIVREKLAFNLRKQWCYLLFREAGQAPLALSPFVASRTCDACGRLEVFVLGDLILGPPGTKVRAYGVTSIHDGLIEVPEQKRFQSFQELLHEQHRKLNEGELTVSMPRISPDTSVTSPGDAATPRKTLPPSSAPAFDPSLDAKTRPSGRPTIRPIPEEAPPLPTMPLVALLYAPADEPFATQLDGHLVPLARNGSLRVWHEGRTAAGEDRERALREHIDQAAVVLVLLSRDLLASTRLWSHVERLLDEGSPNTARVIPVVVRACAWEQTRMGNLKALPRGDKPISSRDDHDVAWLEIVAEALATIQGAKG